MRLNFGVVAPEEVACTVLGSRVDARNSRSELRCVIWLRGTLLARFLSDRYTTFSDGYRHRNVITAFRERGPLLLPFLPSLKTPRRGLRLKNATLNK